MRGKRGQLWEDEGTVLQAKETVSANVLRREQAGLGQGTQKPLGRLDGRKWGEGWFG